jgi:hypothetical protein
VGSVIATLLPLPVVLFQPDMTLVRGVLALLLPGCVQMAVGNFIEPIVRSLFLVHARMHARAHPHPMHIQHCAAVLLGGGRDGVVPCVEWRGSTAHQHASCNPCLPIWMTIYHGGRCLATSSTCTR